MYYFNQKIRHAMKQVVVSILTIVLLFGVLPGISAFVGYASAGEGGARPTERKRADINGAYVPGEVLASAVSLEQAREIAEHYGLKLKSYAYGIAVFEAQDPEAVVMRQEMPRSANRPTLSMNHLYSISGDGRDNEPFIPHMRYMETDTYIKEDIYKPMGVTPMVLDSNLWHHDAMDSEKAWAVSEGADVVVAVVDTGIDIDHPEFEDRISPISYNSATDQIGLVYVQDDDDHGTHLSGIVAASRAGGGNAIGVAPKATILAVKANRPRSGNFDMSSLLRGINYAVENGADIINLSLSRINSDGAGANALEHEIIANAVDRGVTVICASGNQRNGQAGYPAAYDETIAVSSVRDGNVFDYIYSNFGTETDITAPGGSIYATVSDGYGIFTGTSMSSANVSGVAALIKAVHPEYTPARVREILCATARDAGELGKDDYYGHGVVNAYAAVMGGGTTVDVTYDFNGGGSDPVTIQATPGTALIEPDIPKRDGFVFAGWHKENGEAFDFSTEVTGAVTLRATWVSEDANMFAAQFPDPNFRRVALDLLNTDGAGRTDGSDVTIADAARFAAVEVLDVAGRNIEDITGLHYFTGLKELDCAYNRISALTVSDKPNLEYLDSSYNALTALDVSENPALRSLQMSDNTLTALDVSNNILLEQLNLDYNQLTVLNVSANTALTELYCVHNRLESIDLSNNAGLTHLDLSDNEDLGYWGGFDDFDVRANTALESLDLGFTGVWELDISQNTKLEHLGLDYTWLDGLDVSQNIDLEVLWIDYAYDLQELDLSHNAKLEVLYCSYNFLTELDVSNNPALRTLICIDNLIAAIDVSHNPALEVLNLAYNDLTEMDVSHNPLLTGLGLNHNNLSSVDVSHNPVLDLLYVDHNSISVIDVSGNPLLRDFCCNDNYLTGLDVSNNRLLTYLECFHNYIASPDDIIGLRPDDPYLTLIFDEQYPPRVITITEQPADIAVIRGSETDSLHIAASISEDVPMRYQWYIHTSAENSGGTPISGANTAILPINAEAAGVCYYYCEVSALGAKSITSNAAKVTVAVPVNGLIAAVNLTQSSGEANAAFSVTNNNGSAAEVLAIVAAYNENGQLVNTQIETIEISGESSAVTALTIQMPPGGTVRAFIWNSAYTPLTGYEQVTGI